MKVPNWCLGTTLMAIATCLLMACGSSVQSKEELQEYVKKEKNGLNKEKTLGPVKVGVTYRPPDLLAAQEAKGKESNPALMDSLRNNYEQFAHFVLSLSANSKEIESYNIGGGFGERVNVLAFGMKEYVYLLSDTRDTIPVADYFYQRTFGVGGSSDLLFAFNRKEIEKAKWFQFVVDEFGLGINSTRFRFEVGDIKKTPIIEYEN